MSDLRSNIIDIIVTLRGGCVARGRIRS